MDSQLVRGLGEQIVDRLREDIFSGRMEEGERLRESDLAKRFSVSRGPVRDALKQLSWEGFVETDRNKGAQVSHSASDEIQELIIPLRRTIESYAVKLIIHDLTEEDFQRWENILNEMKNACRNRDFPRVSEQDIAFHRLLVERSNSPDLLAIWSVIVARVRRHFRESHLRYKKPIQVYEEHLPLLEAFQKGNVTKAIKALEQHIQ